VESPGKHKLRIKRYKDKNRDLVREKGRKYYRDNKIVYIQYRIKNRDAIRDANRRWVSAHREDVQKWMKNWRNAHVDQCRIYAKEWARDHKKRIGEYGRRYYEENREKVNNYKKQRRRTNLGCRLTHVLRGRLNGVLRGKGKIDHTLALLGCTLDEFKKHLESKFLSGMTWENYGRKGWHVDHIIPCSWFDLSKEEDQRLCFHYGNMQPLWAVDNLSKGNRRVA
jgi:hypothetical protein